MPKPYLRYEDFEVSPQGAPARLCLKWDDPYLMNPDRDPNNDNRLIMPLFVWGYDVDGQPIGFVTTSKWRELTQTEWEKEVEGK